MADFSFFHINRYLLKFKIPVSQSSLTSEKFVRGLLIPSDILQQTHKMPRTCDTLYQIWLFADNIYMNFHSNIKTRK